MSVTRKQKHNMSTVRINTLVTGNLQLQCDEGCLGCNNCSEHLAINCTGGRKYRVNAADLHLPSCWMVESGSPVWAAAVAALILKL